MRLLVLFVVTLFSVRRASGAEKGSQLGNKKTLIAEQPECAEDVRKICKDQVSNNLNVLECLQNSQDSQSFLSEECQNLIWKYKHDLTHSDRFQDAALDLCKGDLEKVPCKPENKDNFISCLLEHKFNITSFKCHQFLGKVATIIFSDYNMIQKFTDSCQNDIEKLKCGRMNFDENALHSQGRTISCLSQHFEDLSNNCQHEILRIAELQSDDFHLDRPLYFACREDREKFCADVHAGEGRVYTCLLRNKNKKGMSDECKEKLFLREKLIMQDYKISHGLVKACRQDIRNNQCRRGTSSNREIKLAQILICLEGATLKGKHVAGECEAEMALHRRMLLEDKNLTPDLLAACSEEIENFCNSHSIDGSILSCLMDHAVPSHQNFSGTGGYTVGPQCIRQVEDLLKVTDASEDWRVDPILEESCQRVVDSSCSSVQPGEGRVIQCLMTKLNSPHMEPACKAALLRLMYFVARDFSLDAQLYKYCHNNAEKFCNAKKDWAEVTKTTDPERGLVTLSCLYHVAYHPTKEKKLDKKCAPEVKRVMRQRALSVDLNPEVEEQCLPDLASKCSSDIEEGDEMECLQDNLEFLEEKCRIAVKNFTIEEVEHRELNPSLTLHCDDIINRYCEDYLDEDSENGDVLECLIAHKREFEVRTSPKCLATIEHFQLISLKDYSFSPKFKESCDHDVMLLCPDLMQHSSTRHKAEIVACLSGKIWQAAIEGKKPELGHKCLDELRSQLLQQQSDIRLNPFLQQSCQTDIDHYCKDVAHTEGKVLECLRENRKFLTKLCQQEIFKADAIAMADNQLDFALVTDCKHMIKRYCSQEDNDHLLECLKSHKDTAEWVNFDQKCKRIIATRMIERSSDIRLNPSLHKACDLEMTKFCAKVILNEIEFSEGKMVACLRDQLIAKKLRPSCEEELANLMKESALDIRQNPTLMNACKFEIKMCINGAQKLEEYSEGEIEECLKAQFVKHAIINDTCKQEVAKLVEAGEADIMADPILYRACSQDIHSHCPGIDHGRGRWLSCLLNVLDENQEHLSSPCSEKLISRKAMFEYAAKVAPIAVETVQELVNQAWSSPSRSYFLIVLTVFVAFIFLGGLFFGRATKRLRAELKNK